jgi:hypothetical protein
MRNGKRLSISLALGSLIAAVMLVTPASAATTNGTWTQYPGPATTYQAQVQQPINSANTSNWSSKSKGGIPVMFKLQSGAGQAVFQSTATQAYSFMSFTPSASTTFTQITNLAATYSFATGDCHGGSLRWEIDTAAGNVFIYYGDVPTFTNCTSPSQSGTNMIGQLDTRYDTTQLGGPFYDTYAHAVSLLGNTPIQDVSLVLDGGWGGNQILAPGTTATVNDNSSTWNSGGTGGFTDTCNLPAAVIQITKLAGDATGPVNEDPVQGSLTDTGNAFRVVDCKYQYVLSIPSLRGVGTYRAEILINDVSVPTPGSPGGQVTFDLK